MLLFFVNAFIINYCYIFSTCVVDDELSNVVKRLYPRATVNNTKHSSMMACFFYCYLGFIRIINQICNKRRKVNYNAQNLCYVHTKLSEKACFIISKYAKSVYVKKSVSFFLILFQSVYDRICTTQHFQQYCTQVQHIQYF